MVLLAKRVSAKREPVKMASTSSADEKRRMRSKISPAFSFVSIPRFPLEDAPCRVSGGPTASSPHTSACHPDGASPSLRICRADANIPEPRRPRPMSRTYHLLRLPFAAVGSSPKRPLIPRADRIHRIPELSRDAGVRRILQHAHPLALLDLPRNLASELKVITLVINRPGFVGLHINAAVSRGNQLLQRQRLFSRQNADIGHA